MSYIFVGKDDRLVERAKDLLAEKIIKIAREKNPNTVGYLADNIYMSERIIKKYMKKYIPEGSNIQPIAWNKSALSRNRNISLEFIKENIDDGWNFCSVAEYAELDIDFVIVYEAKFKNLSCPFYISSNKGLGVNTIELFHDEDEYLHLWDVAGILENPTFNPHNIPDFTKRFIHTFEGAQMYYSGKNLKPYDFVSDDLQYAAWKGFSQNPNITIDFIRKYKDKLDFDLLSSNKAVKSEDIINNSDLNWTTSVIKNPNVNMKVIKMFYDTSKLNSDQLIKIARS